MWEYIENILYMNNFELNEAHYYDIFEYIRPGIKIWAKRAHYKASITGIFIPEDDFISHFEEAIWKGIESYISTLKNEKKYKLSQILMYRLKIAEATVWRNYKNTGTKSDKDRTQYLAGKWLPLSLEPEITFDCLEKLELSLQIKKFKLQFPEDGEVIELLSAGYTPKDVSLIFFKSEEYSSKYRKRINRIREKFKTFIA